MASLRTDIISSCQIGMNAFRVLDIRFSWPATPDVARKLLKFK